METERAEVSFGRSEKASASVILFFLLCLIVIISGIVIVGAYYSYKEHTKKIEDTIGKIEKNVNTPGGPADDQKKNDFFVEYLKEISKGAAQPGNISFLFTVFSIALVSGGVYLLERSRKNVETASQDIRKAENMVDDITRKAEAAKRIADNAHKMAEQANIKSQRSEIGFGIISLLSRGTGASWRLKELKMGDDFETLVPHQRDLVSLVEGRLKDAAEKNMAGSREAELFFEPVFTIQRNLESLPDESKEQVSDIIKRCNSIMKLLRELRQKE